MSKTRSNKKKVFLAQFPNFIYYLCALCIEPHTDASSMEIQTESTPPQILLNQPDIFREISSHLLSNDSKDFYHFCAAHPKFYEKWTNEDFLQKMLTHKEYLFKYRLLPHVKRLQCIILNENINSLKYIQCALLNENIISQLSKSLFIEFVDYAKKREKYDAHDIELTSTLTPHEIINILDKLNQTKKMFMNVKIPVFPSDVLWSEWCAKGLFLAHYFVDKKPSPYHLPEVSNKTKSILQDSATSNNWLRADTQKKNWIQDLDSITNDHPKAALIHAFYAAGLYANFWCKIASKDEILKLLVGPISPAIFMNEKLTNVYHIGIKNCFARAIKGGVEMSHDIYEDACEPHNNHYLRGLNIHQLQQEYINSLISTPNPQDQKK